MPFPVNTTEELLFRSYTQHRDAVRDVMGHGVYPNLVKALATYVAFDDALAGPLSDPDLIEYHAGLMAKIAPYVEQLRSGAAQIVQIMAAIETAAPGTFGISLPVAPPEEPITVSTTGKVGLGYTTTPQTALHIEKENSQ